MQELPLLRALPAADYDTSLKIFRKVYKDCRLSWDGNRYQVPHRVVGKRVMLKIKDRRIRIYDDQTLLVSYQQPDAKGTSLGYPWLDYALRADKKQLKKKRFTGRKGKATRGLVTRSLYPQVAQRPLSEYEQHAAGGVLWNN